MSSKKKLKQGGFVGSAVDLPHSEVSREREKEKEGGFSAYELYRREVRRPVRLMYRFSEAYYSYCHFRNV